MNRQEEKDRAIGTTIAVLDQYVKTMTTMICWPATDDKTEKETKAMVTSCLADGILREVQLLRFLREEQNKESPSR